MDRHARTLLVRLGAVAGLLVAVAATPASADETREYRGTWDGRPVTVVATCTGDTCGLTAAEPFEWVPAGSVDEVWTNPLTTTWAAYAVVGLSAWWVVRRGSDAAADEVAEEPVGGPLSAPAV